MRGRAEHARPVEEYYLRVCRTGRIVGGKLRVARGAAVLLGLVGRSRPPSSEGLWLCPCNGVHTVGMRYGLDIVTLSRDLEVVGVRRAVPPFRVVRASKGGHSTVEFPAGTLGEGDVGVGDRATIEPVPA